MRDYGHVSASCTGTVRGTRKKTTLFSGQYLRNRSTLDIGVLGYIGIVYPKEHSPEVLSIPPGTPCIYRHKGTRCQRFSVAKTFRIALSNGTFSWTHLTTLSLLIQQGY